MGVFRGALGPALMLLPGLAIAQAAPSDFTYAMRYDAAQRVTGTIAPDPDGTGPLHYLAVRNTYDAAGRLTRIEKGELSDWQSEAVAPVAWAGFAVQMQVDTSYDAMRRKTLEVTSGGGVSTATQYSYNSQGLLECTAVRMNPAVYGALPATACTLGTEGGDGPDRIVRNEYDAAGQLLKVQKAYGVAGLQQDYATYTYSANGKQLSVQDANGNLASMAYDGFDRQSQWNFPSKTSVGTASGDDYEAYSYDPNANRTSVRRRDGRTLTFSYDALNRMTSKIVPDGCAPVQTSECPLASAMRDVYYGYDLRGLQTEARFDSTAGEGVTTTYTGFGEIASSTTVMGGISRTIASTYDADGIRSRVTHPDGQFIDYNRDGLDRLYYADLNGTTQLFYPPWDAAGRVSMLYRTVAANWAIPTTYGYDGINRPTSMVHGIGGAGVTSTFVYNPASQITSRTRDNDAYVFTGYLNVSRAYTVNGLNQYTSAGTATFVYDANGNLTSDGTTSYVYDAENRLVSASNGATLTYDPLGRLWQTAGSAAGVTQFLYEGDQLTAEYDGAGTMLRRYVHSDGEDDPLVWYEGAATASPRYLYADHQGSVISVADANGNISSINAYDEYGIPKAGNEVATSGRFQYTGQAWIPEIGMYHYKARIYSPTLGRFLQTDPIGYDDQVNLYAYVANDPVNGRDPSGNDTVVQLQYYPIAGSGNIVDHQYIVMRDTETGATVVSRGGPSPGYNGGSSGASSDRAAPASPNSKENSKLVTTYGPASQSSDTKQPGERVVEGSRVVIPGKFSDVQTRITVFNKAVDSAKLDYKPQSDNSNAYAGTAYKVITDQTAPTSIFRPGSGNDLTPKIPACQTSSKPC